MLYHKPSPFLTFPSADLLWCCSPGQGCPGRATRVESALVSAMSPSVLSRVQTKVATLSGMPKVISKGKCVSTSEVRMQTKAYFFPLHAWPVLTDQHLPSGCCSCFLSGYNALLVCHNGFLKTQMLMGSSRLMRFMLIHEPVKWAVKYLLYVLPFPLSVCVSEHQNFVILPYGKRLKINLILNSSLVQLYYSPDSDPTPRLLLDKGEFTNVTGASYFFLVPPVWIFVFCISAETEKINKWL